MTTRNATPRDRATRLAPAALLALLAGSAMSLRAQAQSTEPFPPVFELSSLLPENGGDGSNGFVLNGIDAVDGSGWSVSSAGDVNGDGVDDLLIGAYGADPNGNSKAGESYVVFGAADLGAGGLGSSGSLELSALNGTDGFVLNGINAEDRSGLSVSSAGDVNGDGLDDLIVGAWRANPNGNDFAGESYVVFGAADLGIGGVGTGGSFNFSALNGSNGFALNGIDVGDSSGFSVSSAGDVNGDGIDDLVIGARGADSNEIELAGESYVVFGALDLGTGGVGTGGSFSLSSLDGTNGFVINGIVARDYSGSSVSSAGDVNGDGIDDLVIGAYLADPKGNSIAGNSYVVFGAADLGSGGVGTGGAFNLSALNGTDGFMLNGIDAGDQSGFSVSSAGDVNGDGIDDLIIGAYGADPNGITYAGESYVVFGAADLGIKGVGAAGSFDLSALNGPNGFALNGIDANDQSGFAVSSAGDANGDGIDDLIIGAWRADPNGIELAGESYVVFGANDFGVGGVGTGGWFNLSVLNGANGFILNGANGFILNGIGPGDVSGTSVSSAGDVNGDGVDDLLIGAPGADPNGNDAAGETYVVFGRNVCWADLNRDGVADQGDIQTFIPLFLAQDLTADLNADGILDLGDIQAFIASFLEGC